VPQKTELGSLKRADRIDTNPRSGEAEAGLHHTFGDEIRTSSREATNRAPSRLFLTFYSPPPAFAGGIKSVPLDQTTVSTAPVSCPGNSGATETAMRGRK